MRLIVRASHRPDRTPDGTVTLGLVTWFGPAWPETGEVIVDPDPNPMPTFKLWGRP